MEKNRYFKDFTRNEIVVGYDSMLNELSENNAPIWLRTLFFEVWKEFTEGNFSYDGATFVREINPDTLFEVASLIHDYFNHIGYVGKNVDRLFIQIMIVLKYPEKDIKLRKFLMNFTFINVIIHIFAGNYLGDIKIENYIKNPKL